MDKRLRQLQRTASDGSLESLQQYCRGLERALQLNIEPFPDFVAPDNSRSRTRDEVEFATRTIHGTEIWTNASDYVRVHDIETGNLIPGCHFTHDEWVNGMMGQILAHIRWRSGTAMMQSVFGPIPADEAEEQVNYLRELKRLVLKESHYVIRGRIHQYIESLERMIAGKSPVPPIIIDPEYPADHVIIRGANNREIRTDTLYFPYTASSVYYFANARELQEHCDDLDAIEYMPAWWNREGYYRLNFDDSSVDYLGQSVDSSYVRITDYYGIEIAYWVIDEWEEAPEEVMGAILGAFGVNRVMLT